MERLWFWFNFNYLLLILQISVPPITNNDVSVSAMGAYRVSSYKDIIIYIYFIETFDYFDRHSNHL